MTLREHFAPSSLDASGDWWFAAPAAEFMLAATTACVSPCFEQRVLRIVGPEARAFLQAQFITNLQRLDRTQGTLSAWCTPQGRVSFQFHLLPCEDGYHLVCPASVAARLLQRLRMFVLRAKVTIEDVSESLGVVGVSLPRDARAPDALRTLVTTRHALSPLDPTLSALCIDESTRFLVCGEFGPLAAWCRASALPLLGSAAWRWLDIAQGHVEITEALAGEFLPQQLNLDMVEALAFDKGCYPGQEVIARLRYRGEVKSRLVRGRAEGAVTAGARLQGDGAHAAGRVVTAVTLPSGWSEFLAVVELAALPAVRLADTPALELSFEFPPYWRT